MHSIVGNYVLDISSRLRKIISFLYGDLVHDLAISTSRTEYSSLNFRPGESSIMIRHVSISKKDLSKDKEEDPVFLLPFEKLRTILIPDLKCEYFPTEVGVNNQSFFKRCISKFNYLRLLDLSNLTLKVLPSSIGNLSHLRYLDLSYNQHIKKLPDSICKLQHLQSLLLINSGKIMELPENMGNLINLRYLALTINRSYLPEVIGRLTSLQTLYIASCKYVLSLGEGVRTLTNLRTLVLVNCQIMKSLSCNMTALENLVIYNCRVLDLKRSGEGIRVLKLFWIVGSDLEALPHWLQESARYYTYLESFPEWFENLTFLQQIKITNCSRLSDFPKGMNRLRVLRELEINNCPLTRRCKREEGEDWHTIAHVPKIILNGCIISSAAN